MKHLIKAIIGALFGYHSHSRNRYESKTPEVKDTLVWKCPSCGLIISNKELVQGKSDNTGCLLCDKHYNDFEPMIIKEPL